MKGDKARVFINALNFLSDTHLLVGSAKNILEIVCKHFRHLGNLHISMRVCAHAHALQGVVKIMRADLRAEHLQLKFVLRQFLHEHFTHEGVDTLAHVVERAVQLRNFCRRFAGNAHGRIELLQLGAGFHQHVNRMQNAACAGINDIQGGSQNERKHQIKARGWTLHRPERGDGRADDSRQIAFRMIDAVHIAIRTQQSIVGSAGFAAFPREKRQHVFIIF